MRALASRMASAIPLTHAEDVSSKINSMVSNMIEVAQRVVLLKRWTSYFNRGRGSDKCYEKFESKNLELLREQLFCTVNLSEDALATKECDEPTLYRKIIEDAEQDNSDAA